MYRFIMGIAKYGCGHTINIKYIYCGSKKMVSDPDPVSACY
jgi:hypothetical protein